MKDLSLHGGNQHAGEGDGLEDMVGVEEESVSIPSRFVAIKEEEGMGVGDGEIWLERQQEDLLDVNDSSIFYNDFPPLPDFPCMSSSSSSSSIPAPAKPIALSSSASSASSSSSSAASWAVLKSDAEEFVERSNNHHNQTVQVQVCKHDQAAAALSSTASMECLRQPPEDSVGDVDCMDVMETFGYMELIDSNEIWDPYTIFQSENPQEYQQLPQPHDNEESLQQNQQLHHHHQQQQQENDEKYAMLSGNNAAAAAVHEQRPPSDDLGVVFFEWLKSNKEHISADDMRSIKLRRATVECASKRLGSTKEGRKQLLKLILEWVEQYQLQKKRLGEAAPQFSFQYQEPFQNPNPNSNLTCNSMPPNINSCFLPSPWIQTPPPPPPYVTDPTCVMVAPPAFQSMGGYSGADSYSNSAPVPPMNQNINGHPNYPPPTEYQMLDSAQAWPPSQYALASQYSPFPDNNGSIPAAAAAATHHPQAFAGYQYPYQYYQGNGEKLLRLGSSATKEARKKRMARQKRFISHHRHQHHHQSHQNQNQNQNAEQQANLGGENCNNAAQANPATWVYWPSVASPVSSAAMPMVPEDPPPPHTAADRPPVQAQNCQQRQVSSERRQGWKPEKNLKFLLQKVLKQSDVGNLGRIVLPKKEAETHLPELEARDGIPIAMEDIGTSRVWNMRYRFWPNNKSRMYLLENTGDFVRANGLQEGDFIVIYSDVKCGKYLIRGVKVRQPGPKSEPKKPAKSHKNLRTAPPAAGSGSSSQPSQKSE